MSKQKRERRAAAGPAMDPAAISYQMSPVPGAPPGPGNMNGNPENVTSLGAQLPSMNGGMQENIYRDAQGLQYPQMGSEVLNPVQVPRSEIQQNTPVTTQGKNAGTPFGLQPQPSGEMADQMEGMRYGQEAMQKGLMANPFMGITGIPAEQAAQGMMIPGAISGTMPGTSGMFLQPMTSMNPMTPGSTPQKTGKKKGNK